MWGWKLGAVVGRYAVGRRKHNIDILGHKSLRESHSTPISYSRTEEGSGEGLVTRLVEGNKCGANGTRHICRFGRFLLLLQSLYLCLLVFFGVLYGGIQVCNMIIQLWANFYVDLVTKETVIGLSFILIRWHIYLRLGGTSSGLLSWRNHTSNDIRFFDIF